MKNKLLLKTCKVGFYLILSLCCLNGIPGNFTRAANETEVVDRIVAIVNDDIIVLSELNEKLKPYVDRISQMGYPPEKEKKMMFKVRDDIINQMVDQKLTDQEVKKYGIFIDDAEIQKTIENIKQKNALTDEEMRRDLAREGLTLDSFKKDIREQMLRARLLNVAVRSKIVITREDARAYFDSHPEEFRGQKKVHLWNIMTTMPEFAIDAEIKDVRARMEKVLTRLDSGEPFNLLARELADKKGPLVANDLGEFRFDVLSPELQDAVGNLKEGEHTKLLDTENGFQIFYVYKIEAGAGKKFDDVESEIQEKLFKERVDKRFKEWLSQLREKSDIQIIR
jgi:peptidyl-prolyl cis-trans isomerase SurA